MWEWRVFWAVDSGEQPDVFKLLKAWSLGEQQRTDVYVAVTNSVGMKWRGEKKLEVKVRNGVDEASGAEQWSKIFHDKVPQPPRPSDLRLAVISTAERLFHSTSNQQLQEAVERMNDSQLAKTVNVTKQRRNGSSRHCSVEQTDLQIAGRQYITVALEGGCPGDVVDLLQTQVEYNGLKCSLRGVLLEKGKSPCGYPEFVVQLLQ